MKTLRISLFALLVLGFSMLVPLTTNSNVFAAEGDRCTVSGSFLGLPTWYKYLVAEEDSTGRCSPVLSGSNTEERVNSALPIGLALLEAMIRLAGVVAVIMIFWAGFKYITSQGNPDAAAGARKTAINALIGLVIVVLSTSIISFMGNRLVGG